MVIDKIASIFVALLLLFALSNRYIKRYSPENLLIIALLSFSTSIYSVLAIYDIYSPIYVQILFFTFSIIIPVVTVFLQYNNIILTRKILYYNMKLAYISKDYQKTVDLIEKIVAKEGRNSQLMYTLGQCYKKLNDFINARDSFVVAIELNDKDYKSYYELGLILDETNKKEKAMEMFKRALSIKKDFYEAEEALGISYTSQGKFKDAVRVYQNALKYHPDSYELYYNIGMIELELGNYEASEDAFRKSSEIKADLYTAHYNVGNICYLTARYDEAIESYKRILNSSTYGPKSYYKIAMSYAAKKEYDKAMVNLEYAIELDSSVINKIRDEIVFDGMRSQINSYLDDRKLLEGKEKQKKNYMNENE